MRKVSTLAMTFPQADLRPMSGRLELAVAEAAACPGARPERVSRVLTVIYETIASLPVTPDLIRCLPSGTREWLVQRAALHFRSDITWFEATCTGCGKPYDLTLDLSEAAKISPPMQQPYVEVETSLGSRSFEVINGEHEEVFAKGDVGVDPRRAMAGVCGLAEQAAEEANQFNDHDLDLIDEALEAVSPDIADQTKTVCPSCGVKTTARIDPLLFAFPKEQDILQDTHLIAYHYGWQHDQILSLSARHREFFAAMIAQDRRTAGRAGARRLA